MNQRSEERREDYQPNGRLDKIEDKIAGLVISTERLANTAENHQKSLDAWERWREKHESEYEKLREDVRETRTETTLWAHKLNGMEASVNRLADQVSKVFETGLKVRGGWIVLTVVISGLMGLVSLAKVFGVIG